MKTLWFPDGVKNGDVVYDNDGNPFAVGQSLMGGAANIREEFYAFLRKNEKGWLQEAEEEEKQVLVESLTDEDEKKLKETHAEDYHGTDDDMPDAFENWLENLSVEELKKLV